MKEHQTGYMLDRIETLSEHHTFNPNEKTSKVFLQIPFFLKQIKNIHNGPFTQVNMDLLFIESIELVQF